MPLFSQKQIELQIMFEKLFSEYIELNDDWGNWLYFYHHNKHYLVSQINNISEIRLNKFNVFKDIILLFYEKNANKLYRLENNVLKKEKEISVNRNILFISNEEILTSYNLPKMTCNKIFDRLELLYRFKDFSPLQVKIMGFKSNIYLLFPESKIADKNNNYSINKNLLQSNIKLCHFVLLKKINFDKDNILRTFVDINYLTTNNGLYYLNQKFYTPIKSRNSLSDK